MLTLLLATRDRAATLGRVLEAYTRLEPPRGGWKLVVVDNGSADASLEIARSFADRLPLVTASEPRPGKNRALNAGLREVEGDLAVFSDDDALPATDWLNRLRDAVDRHSAFEVFGGRIVPLWEASPPPWVLDWVPRAAAFSETAADLHEGPCDPTKVWGPNMAIRAGWFREGHRFDEQLGPDGSRTYAMGGETELTLRLAITEGVACWHCADAEVHHVVRAPQLTERWLFRRAFHLGRCVRRESEQNAAAGRPHLRRDAAAIRRGLDDERGRLARARSSADARAAFLARWQLNVWRGCLHEAIVRRRAARANPHG